MSDAQGIFRGRMLVRLVCVLGFVGGYFAAGKFGLSLAFVHANASAVWPPTGLALAVLVRWGGWLWPGVFAGAFLVNMTTGGSVWANLGIACGNTLEAVVGAMLVGRYAGGVRAFERAEGVLRYVGLAAMGSTTLSATVGVTCLWLDGTAGWSGGIWLTWWLGNVVSNVIVGPFLLVWLSGGYGGCFGFGGSGKGGMRWWRGVEVCLLGLCVVGIGAVVFLPMGFGERGYPVTFMAMLPMLWAAFRFGRRGALTAAVVLSGIALWGTLHGAGPFAKALGEGNVSLLLVQSFMGTMTVGGLVLAAAVTEGRQAHQVVAESEARFRLLADSAPVLMWVNDEEGCRFVNEAYRAFFGVPEEELLGFGWSRFVHPEDKERYIASYKAAAEARAVFLQEVRLRRGDGEYRWVLSCGNPRFLGSGKFAGYVGSCTDITDIAAAREALGRSRDELERVVLERTGTLRQTVAELEAFSYSLSHDMRAPIRAILSFTEIALAEYGEKVGPPATDYLGKVIRAASRLDRLIQDVLAFTRLSREELPVKRIDVEKLLREIISERPELQGPRAEVNVAPPMLAVLGHEASLTQCLTNLLDNAVKFVAPGVRPEVNVYCEARGDHVRLWVEDNGIGMEREVQAQLFQLFQRVHQEGAYPGTGLGLAIVRKAAERMGGSVGVESVLGKGSRFWLELPRA